MPVVTSVDWYRSEPRFCHPGLGEGDADRGLSLKSILRVSMLDLARKWLALVRAVSR